MATTESILDPVYGCVRIKLEVDSQQWLATLVDTGQVADRGVPGWRQGAPQVVEPRHEVDSSAGYNSELEKRHKIVNG